MADEPSLATISASVLAVLAVLASTGCDSTLDIRVWQYQHATVAEVYDADCACEGLAPPFIGQCGIVNDTGRATCSCDAPSTCVERARIELDGATVATAAFGGGHGRSNVTAAVDGDFAGGTFVLEGCDRDVRVELAPEVPATPVASATWDNTGQTHVEWDAMPSIDYVRVQAGTVNGSWCVVAPSPTAIDLRGGGGASVTAIRELPVEPTSVGELHAYAAASSN